MPAGPARDDALDHLLAGQSNDPYWHGLFGGIYLPDLRLANHANLIAAEDHAIGGGSGATGIEVDLDLDGRPEVLLANAGEIVGIKTDEGAGIGRWDLRAARFALAAVLRRRPEAYHEKVRLLDAKHASAADHGGHDGVDDVASIHDVVVAKQAGLSAHLHYDADERRSGLLRFLAAEATAAEAAVEVGDLGDFASGPWRTVELTANAVVLERDGAVTVDRTVHPVHARKTIRIGGGRLDPELSVEVSVANTGDAVLGVRVAIEWSTMLLGGGGNPAAWQEVAGRRVAHDARIEASGVDAIEAGNDYLGIRIDTQLAPAGDVWIAPIETVSNSESGFELVYQGSAALIGRRVSLAPGERATVTVVQRATVAVDRAVEGRVAVG